MRLNMLTIAIDTGSQSGVDAHASNGPWAHKLIVSSRLTCLLLLLLLHLSQHGSHGHHVVLILLMLLLRATRNNVVAIVNGRVIKRLLITGRRGWTSGESSLLVWVGGLEHIHLVVVATRHRLIGRDVRGRSKVPSCVVGARIVIVGWIHFGHDHE